MMNIQPLNKAHQNLYRLVDEVNTNHEPVMIQGKSKNAVLISERDWWAMQQTLYLSSNPEIKAQIQQGLQTSLEQCQDDRT
ncbi:type II toxin-antitoxin system Phd/YefM family antitoxin [Candidatus Albibeggiatoa sp. nov. NOAA]|uniref:type II toxin-antitoxin system Phd/YefM family antitoxin n=1 Tax=Candidatus Albibeggiatoa sp. nov. NOAA TaxID=3162724 RepID=UPI0032F681BA|nr:type II toxin-antitoxin system Phd/YefM family antitoxin [Thiotrichaceae bacterium]